MTPLNRPWRPSPFLDATWSPFCLTLASLLHPLASFWLHFGVFCCPFCFLWLPFVPLWALFGPLWFLFGSLLAPMGLPFGPPSALFGTKPLHYTTLFDIFSLHMASFGPKKLPLHFFEIFSFAFTGPMARLLHYRESLMNC